MQVEIVKGTSKKGKAWEALQVQIGKYKSPLIFPTEIEMMYIRTVIKRQSQNKDIDDIENELEMETE